MIKNFLFHRVNSRRDALWDPMDPRLFEKCIRHITSKYRVELLEDLLSPSPAPWSKKDRIATIVFDDGYKDNIEVAAPILRKYGAKASFYVVTDSIDRNQPTWTYLLDYMFQQTRLPAIDMRFDFLPGPMRVRSIEDQKSRMDYARKLKPLLKKVRHDQRNEVLRRVTEEFHDVEMPPMMMSWDDLRQLRKEGFYIGSHTKSHCMLGTMQDEEEIRGELLGSGQAIQRELGYFPITISYPVGSYDATTIRLSEQAGYRIGLAVKQRPFDPETDSYFEVPRIELYNESWLKTKLRMANIDGVISRIMKRS